ncbi:hypothetical protein VUS55_31510, partial [Pseudomonas aeruginosa]|uniref:hypothetical protein n=1 Tax=Pseudomonas aeruginosa TaxID=287 RepID=UPI0030048AF5
MITFRLQCARMNTIINPTKHKHHSATSQGATAMATQKALTPDQVKQRFRQRGITITQWAAEHGYKRNAVYRVLNGFDKAN